MKGLDGLRDLAKLCCALRYADCANISETAWTRQAP